MKIARTTTLAALTLATVVGAAACSGGSSDRATDAAAKPTPTTTLRTISASGRAPADSPEAAVRALLDAEVGRDHDAAFNLLSSAGLQIYPDAESWFRRRIQLPEITAFDIASVDGDVVVVTAEHDPGLDPFVGLRASRDTQRWTTVHEGDGWLVEPEPEITLDIPDDAPAVDVASEWATAMQKCDESAAAALQVEPALLGLSSELPKICGSTGAVDASTVESITPGPASADLVAQYGDAAFTWARSVHVAIDDVDVMVLLAPIGDAWRVVGVVDA